MCYFFEAGRCMKGTRCMFAHGQEDKREAPDLSFTKMCPLARAGRPCRRQDCKFAHHASELRRRVSVHLDNPTDSDASTSTGTPFSANSAKAPPDSDSLSSTGSPLSASTRTPRAIYDGGAAVPITPSPPPMQPPQARRFGGSAVVACDVRGDPAPMMPWPMESMLPDLKTLGYRADFSVDQRQAPPRIQGQYRRSFVSPKKAPEPVVLKETKADSKPLETMDTSHETVVVVKNSFVEVVVADAIGPVCLRRAKSLSSF